MSFKDVEAKWLKEWEKNKVFEVEPDGRDKFFVTFPFPYMDGPLHIGSGFTGGRLDVVARYKRMKGYNVLFPWAWHWTGEAVMGISNRIRKGDERAIWALREVDHVPEEVIKKFVDPRNMVRYYTDQSRRVLRRTGFSIDWRREFHTSDLHPAFTKFVEWQIKKLGEKGYIRKGTHPVVWCPECKSPTGDHDRLEGEGVRPEEYTLVKFRLDDSWLVAGTFRPETVFGVTNLWINPNSVYVIALVDGEKWIVSREALEKLGEQLRRVEVIREAKGEEFVGKRAVAPLVGKEVPVLPGSFVDSNVASGVVYSVPSHAPIDWLALRDLKEDAEKIEDYKLREEEVVSIEPISIIRVEGFGDHPAIEVCYEMGIEDQLDPKGEKATETVYTKEFHMGVMKENCDEFYGLSVREAKEAVKEKLLSLGLASTMYDLPQRVICRSGATCITKVIENQWFLKYSEEEWKDLAREAIAQMNFYPPELRELFLHYVDWYHDWACTRRTGLGTPFPYDRDWIVETLTDSTIYMAFYVLSKYYNSGQISPQNLCDEFLDYVLLGEGRFEEVGEKTGVSLSLLKRIREDFLYWYPVDLRGSGKDLVGNHLTFYIFHHVAIFPRQLWPKAITVNGYMMLEGRRTSKSRGWFIPLWEGVEKYGADATRMTSMLGAEGLDDPDWRSENAAAAQNRLKAIRILVKAAMDEAGEGEEGFFERLLLSKLQGGINSVEGHLEEVKTASAARILVYDMYRDLQEYVKLTERVDRETVKTYVDAWTRMLQPYVPFTAEEIWHSVLGRESFVSLEDWPTVREELVSPLEERLEEYVNDLLDDIKEVLKVLPTKMEKVYLYVASGWKWTLLDTILNNIDPETNKIDFGFVMERVRERHPYSDAKRIAVTLKETMRSIHEIKDRRTLMTFIEDPGREEEVLRTIASRYAEKKLGLELIVQREEEVVYDPAHKAPRSTPLRPGIYLE